VEDKEIVVPHKKGFYEKYIKRPLDVVCSGAGLIVLSPVMLVVALLVRVKLGSPVIFSQERPGLNEKIFKLYKFRSMTDKRDGKGNLLPDKERLTSFGKWLRGTSLDELPELVNIIRGDMSVVGPRPLTVQYLPFYTENERRRHSIRPGLTGEAQVMGRNNLPWDERFVHDLSYVDDITFLKDVKIMLLTLKKVFSGADVTIRGEGEIQDFDLERKSGKSHGV